MFKHLSELTPRLVENDAGQASLSEAEIKALQAKFDKAEVHLEALFEIFRELKEDELDLPIAYKMHHLGHKAGLDMSYFKGMGDLLDKMEDNLMDMHMAWMSMLQGEEEYLK